MNSREKPQPPAIPDSFAVLGAVPLHRDHIADMAGRVAIYAGHAVDYAQLGDDVGLNRSIRLLFTLATHAAEALPKLREVVEADERLRAAARAAAPTNAGNGQT